MTLYFQLDTDAMQPVFYKDDIIEGIRVDTIKNKSLKGLYVLIQKDKAMVCRVDSVSSKSDILNIYCDGRQSKLSISEITDIYKVERLIDRHSIV